MALLTMLAILEHGHDNGEVDSITALMCRVSEHHRASARRTYISDADKIRELADWKTVKEALGGKGPWAAQLPPSDIEREVSRFSPRASKTIVDDSHELLTVAIDTIRLFERAEIARLPALGHAAVKIPRTACGQLSSLVFSSATTVHQLARYMAVLKLRMEKRCGPISRPIRKTTMAIILSFSAIRPR